MIEEFRMRSKLLNDLELDQNYRTIWKFIRKITKNIKFMNCLNFLWNILTYVRFWQHFPVKTQLTEVLSLSRGKIGSFCFSASEVDRSHRSIRTENLKFIFNVSAKI